MEPQLDYIASIQWMWYKNKWFPRNSVFASIYDAYDVVSVVTETSSLTEFSYSDVVKNQSLPNDPWAEIPDHGKNVFIKLTNLEEFLGREFFEEKLKNGSGWNVNIGTLDMATYLYLEPILPNGTVHFIGPSIMPEGTLHLMGPHPDIREMARIAAQALSSKNNWFNSVE